MALVSIASVERGEIVRNVATMDITAVSGAIGSMYCAEKLCPDRLG
jgi:hypothetical protein